MYRAGPSTREFEKTVIDKMFELADFKPAERELVVSIAFAPKNTELLRVRVDWIMLHIVIVRDS